MRKLAAFSLIAGMVAMGQGMGPFTLDTLGRPSRRSQKKSRLVARRTLRGKRGR